MIWIGVVACAHDVTAVYAPATPASGAVDVVLGTPSRSLSVTIGDQLVVDRAYSRRAHVVGIPAGPMRVHVATGGGCETGSVVDRDVLVPPAGKTTLALPGPELGSGCAVLNGLLYVGMNIGILAIAVLGAAEVVDVGHARPLAR